MHLFCFTSTTGSVHTGSGGLQSTWMKLRWGLYIAILAAPALGAATIDVSSETSTLVRTGDTLVFQLLTWNFGVNAAAFGLPLSPTDVSFQLVSAPLSLGGGFAATLESADRGVSVPFDSLSFGLGFMQSAEYAGEVSTLQGFLSLSPLLAESLFSDGTAVIALRNEGQDVTVGLSPYVLRNDLYTSLSGGPLSVGALPGPVELETQENRARLLNWGGPVSFGGDTTVPEPQSAWLFLGGGALLCGLSRVLARVSRRRP
jgi:hypothetical protein